MSPEAIDFVRPWLDGINIDLSLYENFYRDLCKGRFEPVKETIRTIAQKTDIWMEITTLIVPGKNDSPAELKSIAEFIAHEASVDVPWHISRFYPQYKMEDRRPTSQKSLEEAYEIGKEAGLRYIYIGNLPGVRAESTYCYSCGTLLIDRVGYTVKSNVIEDGTCPSAGPKSPVSGCKEDLYEKQKSISEGVFILFSCLLLRCTGTVAILEKCAFAGFSDAERTEEL